MIANIGISGGTAGEPEGPDQASHIFVINVDEVLHTMVPANAAMNSHRSGQIGLISSIAGFLGLPNTPAYHTSEATVDTLREAILGPLAIADATR